MGNCSTSNLLSKKCRRMSLISKIDQNQISCQILTVWNLMSEIDQNSVGCPKFDLNRLNLYFMSKIDKDRVWCQN